MRVKLSRRPFVNGGIIILTPTGDRNGSHARSKIDIDLFIVSNGKCVYSFRRYHGFEDEISDRLL